MSHFVLIHGAGYGAWCWHKTVAALQDAGEQATAIDLPGAGIDPTPLDRVSLATYTTHIGEALKKIDGQVVLVGHSLGGVAITQAAEHYPHLISGLIYVTAYLPNSGESAYLASLDLPADISMTGVEYSADGSLVHFKLDELEDVFYHDCPGADIVLAKACLKPLPVGISIEPVTTTPEKWGSVPRSYIICANDRSLVPANQKKMIEKVGCRQVAEIATGHSPFFAAPAELASLLVSLTQ